MQLPDVILRQRNVLGIRKDGLHYGGVASDFLFVPRGK